MINAVTASILRPNTNLQYSIGDKVGLSQFTFEKCADFPMGSGYITKAILLMDLTAVTTNAEFRLYLYSKEIDNVETDNVAFESGLSTYLPFLIGYIDFVCEAGVTNIFAQVIQPNISFVCQTQNLYGVLVANKAYTPVAFQNITVMMDVDQF